MNQHPMIKVEVKIKKQPTQESLIAASATPVDSGKANEKDPKKSKGVRKNSNTLDEKNIRYNYEIVTKP